MYVLKVSAIKRIKICVITIAKITDANAGIENVLNYEITSISKLSANLSKTFPNLCEVLLKQFISTLDDEKLRLIIVNITKAHIMLVKKTL